MPMQKNGNGKSDGKENLKKNDSAFSKYTNDDFVQCVAQILDRQIDIYIF